MKNMNNNLSIIPIKFNDSINGKTSNYLDYFIDDIKILNWITNQFKLKINERDFLIKFKKFTDKKCLILINQYFN